MPPARSSGRLWPKSGTITGGELPRVEPFYTPYVPGV